MASGRPDRHLLRLGHADISLPSLQCTPLNILRAACLQFTNNARAFADAQRTCARATRLQHPKLSPPSSQRLNVSRFYLAAQGKG